MVIRAGELRHRLELQQATRDRDTFGTPTLVWSTVAAFRASVEAMPGRDFVDDNARRIERPVTIRCRYRTDIGAGMRLKEGGTVYDLQGPPIDPDGKRRELQITALVRAYDEEGAAP